MSTLSLSLFTTGSTIPSSGAGSVDDKLNDIEAYVNYGIGTAEVDTDFVDQSLIFKPDFYGGPAARTRFETAVMHYRYRTMSRTNMLIYHPDSVVYDVNDDGSGWQWVPYMSATFNVSDDGSSLVSGHHDTCRAIVYARCYAFETGGGSNIFLTMGSGPSPGTVESSSAIAFQMALFVNGTRCEGTLRNVYRGGGPTPLVAAQEGPWQFTRKELSWAVQIGDMLQSGINSIGIKFRIYPIDLGTSKTPTTFDAKNIQVQGRNFVVDSWFK